MHGPIPPLIRPTLVLLAMLPFAGCTRIVATTQRAGTVPVERSSEFDAPDVEAISLAGRPLRRPAMDPQALSVANAKLAEARERYLDDPAGVDNIIWYARRLAYLGRYRKAIEVYTEGLQRYPDEIRLLRHRGHRYITTRQIDLAIADLSRAAQLIEENSIPDEVEPDGLPNAENRPRSTTNSNVYYHLGLAHFIRGDYERARDAWLGAMQYASFSDDMLVATVYWLHNAYRRLGRDSEASALLDRTLRDDMEILENDTYLDLLRMYAGARTPGELLRELSMTEDDVKFATLGYGIACHHIAEHHESWAVEIFDRILARKNWAAFGYICAEADAIRYADFRRPDEPDPGEDEPAR